MYTYLTTGSIMPFLRRSTYAVYKYAISARIIPQHRITSARGERQGMHPSSRLSPRVTNRLEGSRDNERDRKARSRVSPRARYAIPSLATPDNHPARRGIGSDVTRRRATSLRELITLLYVNGAARCPCSLKGSTLLAASSAEPREGRHDGRFVRVCARHAHIEARSFGRPKRRLVWRFMLE